MSEYLARHLVHVSAVTVIERIRGYPVLWWRFDAMIAATALVSGLRLIHNNAADFEAIRSAIEGSPERFPKLGPLELVRCTSLV